MNTLLGIFTCQRCSAALLRHWTYFLNQQADDCWAITTTDTKCEVPCSAIAIGHDEYINGDHLPRRMLDTIEALLEKEWDTLILAEYDTVFFNRIPVEKMRGFTAGHLAGYKTWGSKASQFFHNPHVFSRDAAKLFLEEGRKAIDEGICGKRSHDAYGTPESSPDVFFGYICEQLNFTVQTDLWSEFSRNSLDLQGDLDHARTAYLQGVDVIHGVKTKKELDYITGQ